jgi:hypothetical protein
MTEIGQCMREVFNPLWIGVRIGEITHDRPLLSEAARRWQADEHRPPEERSSYCPLKGPPRRCLDHQFLPV